MSDAIKGGMYRGENKVRSVSLDKRISRIKTEDGQYVDVPSMAFVRELQQQILDLQNRLDIVEEKTIRQDIALKRHAAGIRKVDSKLR